MNGDPWTNASGLGNDTPLGGWYGVTVENRRITELSLPDNALEGPIPRDVANFGNYTLELKHVQEFAV